MLTASNSLSFVRAPLAFLFMQDNTTLRIIAVILAMVTDSIDGYVARKNQTVSRFGAILDPVMDKFFVYFALTALFLEQKMTPFELTTILSRDLFLLLYGTLRFATKRWDMIFLFRAIRWGKVTTALQFIVLIGLILDLTFPWYVFASFILMGWLAFLELFQHRSSTA